MPFPETLTITITEDDVTHGRRRSCSDCPTARAIQRALGPDTFVEVSDNRPSEVCRYTGEPDDPIVAERAWYVLPEPLRQAIACFDLNRPWPALTSYLLARVAHTEAQA